MEDALRIGSCRHGGNAAGEEEAAEGKNAKDAHAVRAACIARMACKCM